MKNYKDYQEYIAHQKEKSENKKRIAKWIKDFEWQKGVFLKRFALQELPKPSKILCLGSRLGAEVGAFKSLGHEAIGIDICPHPPLTILGDFHNLEFKDNSFNLVYTNSYDHALYPEKMLSEVKRVLKLDGAFWLEIFLNQTSEYEVQDIQSIKDVIKLVTSNGFTLQLQSKSLAKLYGRKANEISLLFGRHM